MNRVTEIDKMQLDRFIVGDAVKALSDFPPECIDLTVTSPPYENLRDCNGFSFTAETMLSALYRVTKKVGVCVWVVSEKIKNGRSLSSFNHAFVGKDCGFVVHDVMIYQKKEILRSCVQMPTRIAMN